MGHLRSDTDPRQSPLPQIVNSPVTWISLRGIAGVDRSVPGNAAPEEVLVVVAGIAEVMAIHL